MRLLDSLRRDGFIREADPNRPVYEGWRDDPIDMSWVNNPAIQSKTASKTQRKTRAVKPKEPMPCSHEGCSENAHKSGLCSFHWQEEHRERNRLYRAKRRAQEKALAIEKAKDSGRACSVCGLPVPSRYKTLLCREHHRELSVSRAKKYIQKLGAEVDQIKEATMQRNAAIVAKKWGEIQARYAQNQPC